MKLVSGHVVECSEDYLSVGDVLRHFRMTSAIVLRHDAGIHFITLDLRVTEWDDRERNPQT